MAIREHLREDLNIIAEMAHNDSSADVIDTAIYQRLPNIPKDEINNHLNELSSLGLIAQILPRPSGVDFRLYHITAAGLKELEDQDLR